MVNSLFLPRYDVAIGGVMDVDSAGRRALTYLLLLHRQMNGDARVD